MPSDGRLWRRSVIAQQSHWWAQVHCSLQRSRTLRVLRQHGGYLKLADQADCDLRGQVKDTIFDLAA